MSEKERTTLELIHEAAKKEFLAKGYKSASLRSIVKAAGVTTGALYGYYDSKERLFDALVGAQYETLMGVYKDAMRRFAELPPEEQPENMSTISYDAMHRMLLYAYDDLDAYKLLLTCAEGTRYEGMIDEMVEIETKGTHDFQEVLNALDRPSPRINPKLEHILITGMFNAYFELIIHDMPLREAENYLSEMWDFYNAGWLKIMGQGGEW